MTSPLPSAPRAPPTRVGLPPTQHAGVLRELSCATHVALETIALRIGCIGGVILRAEEITAIASPSTGTTAAASPKKMKAGHDYTGEPDTAALRLAKAERDREELLQASLERKGQSMAAFEQDIRSLIGGALSSTSGVEAAPHGGPGLGGGLPNGANDGIATAESSDDMALQRSLFDVKSFEATNRRLALERRQSAAPRLGGLSDLGPDVPTMASENGDELLSGGGPRPIMSLVAPNVRFVAIASVGDTSAACFSNVAMQLAVFSSGLVLNFTNFNPFMCIPIAALPTRRGIGHQHVAAVLGSGGRGHPGGRGGGIAGYPFVGLMLFAGKAPPSRDYTPEDESFADAYGALFSNLLGRYALTHLLTAPYEAMTGYQGRLTQDPEGACGVAADPWLPEFVHRTAGKFGAWGKRVVRTGVTGPFLAKAGVWDEAFSVPALA